VRVRVDQPGHQRHAARVDHFDVLAPMRCARDRRDPVAADQNLDPVLEFGESVQQHFGIGEQRGRRIFHPIRVKPSAVDKNLGSAQQAREKRV